MTEVGTSKASLDSSVSTSAQKDQQHVIVCGGGVIGCCTAYFLGKKGVKVTVVEKTGIACAASGKAGGFLALDWCDGSVVGGLARASYALHAQLANELNGETYGYRQLDSLSVTVEEPRDPKHVVKYNAKPRAPAWIDGSIKGTIHFYRKPNLRITWMHKCFGNGCLSRLPTQQVVLELIA